jgi:hypothetical protein
MEAFSQKFATKTDANYLYTQIERVQNQPQSTVRRIDSPSDDEVKKPPSVEQKKPPTVEQATYYMWTFLAAFVVLAAIIGWFAANERVVASYDN